jgi:nucleotide-binding universal stress UspA family protein
MILSTLLLAVPSAALQTPAQEVVPVVETAESKLASLDKRYGASKLSYPDRFAAFQAEYATLAQEYRGSEVGMHAEVFLLRGLWWLDASERSDVALEHLAKIRKDYGKSKHLVHALDSVRMLVAADQREALFAELGEASPHAEVKAVALLFRAKAVNGEARETMLKKLDKQYGHLRYKYSSLHDIADSLLNPHPKAELAVGKLAPEITGVDLNGKPMKLSDFRGKVVVLDFWGDW